MKLVHSVAFTVVFYYLPTKLCDLYLGSLRFLRVFIQWYFNSYPDNSKTKTKNLASYLLAYVAGGMSVGGLYYIGGGAARSLGTSQFELGIFPRVASRVESNPGTRILPATQTTNLAVFYSPTLYGDMSIYSINTISHV